jgi:lysophospholipase L1-like esterase
MRIAFPSYQRVAGIPLILLSFQNFSERFKSRTGLLRSRPRILDRMNRNLRMCAAAFLFTLPPSGVAHAAGDNWIGTWATSAQPPRPGTPESYRNQTLRLIVHTSVGGKKVRIKISNTYGDRPLLIGAAHVARRASEADIDRATDRALKFRGGASTRIPPGSIVTSDPVDLDVAALSDLAISLYFPESTPATTLHILSKQTNYIAAETGDSTAFVKFHVGNKFRAWPFLTGVDVEAPGGSSNSGSIVALGSSLTDGDGSTGDTNHRWPDLLAERLHKAGGRFAELGVLNQGIIGNRLLQDSPQATTYGRCLGESGVSRFDRDVLEQAGVKYVIVGLGINDIAFPGSLTPAAEFVKAESIIAAYRLLIARAHQKGIRIIGTTNPVFEDSFLVQGKSRITFFTPDKEFERRKVNAWILNSKEFDAAIDFDAAVRDPNRPSRILPTFDSDDHLHPNDAGYMATADLIPLTIFGRN